jgi:hypothetical protein
MTAADEAALVPPLLVADGWDLLFFRSQEALGSYLEPWFPGQVSYKAWESEGRRLRLVNRPVAGSRRPREVVTAELGDDQTDSAAELDGYLREWLRVLNRPVPEPDTPLAELVLRALMSGDLR